MPSSAMTAVIKAAARRREEEHRVCYDGRRDGVVFTSRSGICKNAASAPNILIESIKGRCSSSRKRTRALERLAGWLRARNADRDGKIDLPPLRSTTS